MLVGWNVQKHDNKLLKERELVHAQDMELSASYVTGDEIEDGSNNNDIEDESNSNDIEKVNLKLKNDSFYTRKPGARL